MASVRHAIAQFAGLTEAERAALAKELAELEADFREARSRPGRDRAVRRDRHGQVRFDQCPGRSGRGRGGRARRLDQGSLAHRLERLRIRRAGVRAFAGRAARHAGHQRGGRPPTGHDRPRRGGPGRSDPVRHRLGLEPYRVHGAGGPGGQPQAAVGGAQQGRQLHGRAAPAIAAGPE